MQNIILILLIAIFGVIAKDQITSFDLFSKMVASNKALTDELENLDESQTIISTAFDLGAVAYQAGQSCPANTRRWTHSSGVILCIPLESLCETSGSVRVPCVITSRAGQSMWMVSFLSLMAPSAYAQTMPTISVTVPMCNSSDADCVDCSSPNVICLSLPLCKKRSANCATSDSFVQTFALPIPKSAMSL